MKKVVLSAALLLALLAAFYFAFLSPRPPEAYQRLSMDSLPQYLETSQNFILVDVRSPEEFASGHIPGAVNLPVETLELELDFVLTDPEQSILLYCHSGNRSRQAAEKLLGLGWKKVIDFGGIKEWPGPIELSSPSGS